MNIDRTLNPNYNTVFRSPNFTGVKLANPDFKSARNIMLQLKRVGFDCLGHKTRYCNNETRDKIKMAKFVRENSSFGNKEYGVLFFPWSGEAYIMANPKDELTIYRILKQYDDDVAFNFLI